MKVEYYNNNHYDYFKGSSEIKDINDFNKLPQADLVAQAKNEPDSGEDDHLSNQTFFRDIKANLGKKRKYTLENTPLKIDQQ